MHQYVCTTVNARVCVCVCHSSMCAIHAVPYSVSDMSLCVHTLSHVCVRVCVFVCVPSCPSHRRISTDGGGICHAEPHIKKRHVASCAVSLAFLLEFSSRIDAEMSTLDVVYKVSGALTRHTYSCVHRLCSNAGGLAVASYGTGRHAPQVARRVAANAGHSVLRNNPSAAGLWKQSLCRPSLSVSVCVRVSRVSTDHCPRDSASQVSVCGLCA